MVRTTIPSLELLRDLPLKIALPDDLRADVAASVAELRSASELPAMQRAAARAEAVTLRAIAHLEAEAARLTQERFAAEDAGALRRRLVDEPKQRAEALVASMRQRVAGEKPEWSRRLDKQTRDLLDAMRKELAKMAIEDASEAKDGAVRAVPKFRERFGEWTDAAMDSWTAHLGALVEAQYAELLRPELDALAAVLGARIDPELPTPAMPVYRVQIPDAALRATYDSPSFFETVFAPLKGGLDLVALITGLLVVPIVGRLMDESPIVLRATVVGGMISAVIVVAVSSGLRTRRKLVAAAKGAARGEIAKNVEASFTAQLERFRADAERACHGAMLEALRTALRVVEPAIARFVEAREASAVTALASAQLKLDRIADQLRTIRSVKYALEEQLLVDLRRSLAHA